MLNNISPLDVEMQAFHLKYPMCYAKCHDVNFPSFEKLLMLTNQIMMEN
jgi:hypothetical protein